MTLDNTRNRTLQTNLTISIASFALMVATVPAGFFGMNLLHGWVLGSKTYNIQDIPWSLASQDCSNTVLS